MISIVKFSKGHNSVKTVDGVMVLLLARPLKIHKFVPSFMKISQRVS